MVRFLDGLRFEAESRGIKIVSDQPTDNGGQDTGMTPPEFFLAAIGTCTGHYALQYLRTRQLSTAGLTIKVEASKVLQPARMENFRILIDAPGLEDQRHREGILRAAKNCLIHNTLLHAPAVEIAMANPVQELEGV
jgi:putative redox protein